MNAHHWPKIFVGYAGVYALVLALSVWHWGL